MSDEKKTKNNTKTMTYEKIYTDTMQLSSLTAMPVISIEVKHE